MTLRSQFKTLVGCFVMITSFIKTTIFSVVYCANSETEDTAVSENASQDDLQNTQQESKKARYYCKMYGEPGSVQAGLEIGIEVIGHESNVSILCCRFEMPVKDLLAQIAPSFATYYFSRQLVLHIRQYTDLPKYKLIPIYVGSALATGFFYLSAMHFQKYYLSLGKLAEDIEKKNSSFIKVEIIKGELSDAAPANFNDIYQFIRDDATNPIASSRRARTSEIEEDMLPGGIQEDLTDDLSNGAFNDIIDRTSSISSDEAATAVINAVTDTISKQQLSVSTSNPVEADVLADLKNWNFDEYLSPKSSPTSRIESLHLKDAEYAFNDSPRDNSVGRSGEIGPSSGVPVDLSGTPSEDLGLSDSIVPKDNFDSPKSAFGDKSWNASSPLESLEFESLLKTVINCSLGMLIIVLLSLLWLRLSFVFPELKKTKPYLLEKYVFLKKINTYYESLTPEQLKTLRILYISLSLYASGGLFFILTRFWFAIKYTIESKS